ncbi:hypothetical protein Tco_0489907 [Tanacetum coccineum]
MELRLERGSTKITRQKVNDMLGIQMGSMKLEDLEQKPLNDPFIKKWEEQFKHLKKPTPTTIASVIKDIEEADFMFKMNFVTLFGSTMGTLENGGRVSTKLLKRISEDVDISDIDWLLYLDSTIFPDLQVMRHRPALRSWNTTTMKKRITMETEKRCLGKLEHHGDFDTEEEQDGLNLYKGLDVYVEPINDREPETKEERSELVRTLRDGVKKFEEDQMMIDFCKQYGKLFNDDEFNQYESSNDEDSEGDAAADNDKNNNNDDDGAPKADANKQNKSDNQKEEKNKEDIDKVQKKVQEVQDDENEEKMTGDNREVTVQIEVDNQNEEKVETEKEKQDKSDKVENVQEKQDADTVEKVQELKDQHNDLAEDEFWNTKTDSQIDKLMSQAETDIKNRKTPERKSIVDMTLPTFSLGLSPEEHELKSNKVEEQAAKRAKKNSRFLVSPYLNKKTTTNGKTEPDEVMITNYLFSMEGSEFDFIFETKEGNATIRDYMQTLAPNLKIESNVIDTYCLVLNHEQEMDNKGKKTKHFFHTRMIVKLEFPEEDEGNTNDIIRMTVRFAAKMLSHEINIHREKISKEAVEFAKHNNDKKKREAMILEAIKIKKQKQDSERVASAI